MYDYVACVKKRPLFCNTSHTETSESGYTSSNGTHNTLTVFFCRFKCTKTSDRSSRWSVGPAADGQSDGHSVRLAMGHVSGEAQCHEGGVHRCAQGKCQPMKTLKWKSKTFLEIIFDCSLTSRNTNLSNLKTSKVFFCFEIAPECTCIVC